MLPYVSADDSAHVVEFGIHPIYDDSGNIIFLHPTGIDITERIRAEQALRDRAEESRSILATSMDGFWRIDQQGRFLDVNDRKREAKKLAAAS